MYSESETIFKAISALTLAIGLTLGGIANGAPASADRKENTIVMALYGPGLLQDLPIYLGQKKGIFQKHGIDLQLTTVKNGVVGTSALISGDIDVLGTSLGAGIPAAQKGAGLQILANDVRKDVGSLIFTEALANDCVDSKKPYPAPFKCLKGKRFGLLVKGGTTEIDLNNGLSAVGLTQKDVSIVVTDTSSATLAGLKGGSLDAAIVNPPFAEIAEKTNIGKRIMAYSDLNTVESEWSQTVYWGRKQNMDARKKTFSAFRDAVAESIAYVANPANSDEMADLLMTTLSSGSPLTKDVVVEALKRYGSAFSVKILCKGITTQADALKSVIPNSKSLDDCYSIVWADSKSIVIDK
ncbi:MAG: ABC transporter substrate-binding protein [Burkholderiales bacterium]|nr:ABC transporter substrate-binding protein [Burkholderiales bacterium]